MNDFGAPYPELGPIGPFILSGKRNTRMDSGLHGPVLGGSYALVVLASGLGELHANGVSQRVLGPAAMLLQPGIKDTVTIAPAALWMRLIFDMRYRPYEIQGVGRWPRDNELQPSPEALWGCTLPLMLPDSCLADVRVNIERCLALWWRSQLGYMEANHHLGLLLLRLVARLQEDQQRERQEADWVLACRRYIDERMELGVTVQDLAALVDMPISSFRMRWQAEVEESPRQSIIAARMQRARQLLRGDHVEMKHVAVMCGYQSVPSFCLQFRKFHGSPPKTWRRQDLGTA